jgi:hypothetical protein
MGNKIIIIIIFLSKNLKILTNYKYKYVQLILLILYVFVYTTKLAFLATPQNLEGYLFVSLLDVLYLFILHHHRSSCSKIRENIVYLLIVATLVTLFTRAVLFLFFIF